MTYTHPDQANAPGKRDAILSLHANESLGMKVEYVIAHYKEDLEWLMPVRNQAHIYHKGENKISLNDFKLVKTLPNIGREGHTYLKHIVDNYDHLADITFFLQGHIDDHIYPGNSPRKMLSDTLSQGVSFANNVFTYSSWGFAREWLESNHFKNMTFSKYTFGAYWEYIFKRKHPEQISISYGGCFAVTKEKIYKHPKEFYIRILNTMEDGSNPEVGHYLERMWVTIFK